jgi:hypothetical protein
MSAIINAPQPTSVTYLFQAGTVSTLFSATALPASSAWRQSQVVGVQGARQLGLWLKYDAAGTSGLPNVVVMASSEKDQPALGDDSWFEFSLRDVALGTPTAFTGTLPTGYDPTTGELRNLLNVKGPVIRPMPAASAAGKIRQFVSVDVGLVKWVYVMAQEIGAAGTPGTLSVGFNICE